MRQTPEKPVKEWNNFIFNCFTGNWCGQAKLTYLLDEMANLFKYTYCRRIRL